MLKFVLLALLCCCCGAKGISRPPESAKTIEQTLRDEFTRSIADILEHVALTDEVLNEQAEWAEATRRAFDTVDSKYASVEQLETLDSLHSAIVLEMGRAWQPDRDILAVLIALMRLEERHLALGTIRLAAAVETLINANREVLGQLVSLRHEASNGGVATPCGECFNLGVATELQLQELRQLNEELKLRPSKGFVSHNSFNALDVCEHIEAEHRARGTAHLRENVQKFIENKRGVLAKMQEEARDWDERYWSDR